MEKSDPLMFFGRFRVSEKFAPFVSTEEMPQSDCMYLNTNMSILIKTLNFLRNLLNFIIHDQ